MKKNDDFINIEDVAKEEHFRPVDASDGFGSEAELQEWRRRRSATNAEHAENGDGREEPPTANGPQDYGSGTNGGTDQQRAKGNGARARHSSNGAEKQEVTALFDPWAQFTVPDFPFDVLPDVAREFVASESEVIGADPSALAMAVLSAFSGALDHRFALKIMRHGNWWEHPRLWTLLVGASSEKKTPIINRATRPLEEYQNRLLEAHETEVKAHIAAGGKPEDGPPMPPRYVAWDTTTEKLGELLARSDHGLLIKRDELAGWIGSMEKYGGASHGGGSDRAIWLKAYDGGPYAFDRIKRGECHIRNLSVSLIGGIQPDRLRQLHGLTSDGLLQRFIPVMMKNSKLAQDRPSDDAAYAGLVRELIFAKHARLIMSGGALAVTNDIRSHLHHLERASSGLAVGFQAFVGKLEGYAGRLALILHMAWDPAYGATREVEQSTMENVRRLVLDFLLPHAFEFYRTAESSTDGDRLQKVASWILTAGKPQITTRDLARNVTDFRGVKVFEINQRLSPLVAAGWLEPIEPGPVCRTWNVSPAVFAQFAERARVEDARKAVLAKLMGSPRKQENAA